MDEMRPDPKRPRWRRALVLLAALAALASLGWALKVTVTGSWSLVILASDLSGPGGTFPDYESAPNQVTVEVIGVPANRTWAMDVRRVDTSWPASWVLSVRRSSVNEGLTGGETYQVVTTADQQIYQASKVGNNQTGILMQYLLSNVTPQVPGGTYTTTIYYTYRQL